MTERQNVQLKLLAQLAWPAYAVAAFMILLPVLDFGANVWPPTPDLAEWRYAAVGMLSGFLFTPMLGIVMVLAAAALLEHRLVIRLMSYTLLLFAVILLGCVLLFVLDAVQVRAAAAEETRPQLVVGAVMAIAKHVLAVVCFVLLALFGLRAIRGPSARRSRHDRPVLVARASAGERGGE